ncbi:hypothetical protein T265_10727 [Opisthorchis viverrini]|uniref:Uncharacterized protein n=1 Tax=Opisthorchis viverrini TaxID=6198 RepID=A0A074Z5I3_OPIVI|nr:hypothetical protein T265_10727 [Opisthorchis viverrini]KER20787.1 hypothetical protein T265_10727 [Opisthorchis viverrini]
MSSSSLEPSRRRWTGRRRRQPERIQVDPRRWASDAALSRAFHGLATTIDSSVTPNNRSARLK